MFDFNDEIEEEKREKWYAPIGEFALLFSNLEFSSNEWIDLLSESKVISQHIKSIWSFQKRVEIIINLIDEYQADETIKNRWKHLWGEAKNLIPIRNTIAHNPPFDNYGLEFDSKTWEAKDIIRTEEIQRLNKPLGEPGSGITLEKLEKGRIKLREILNTLDHEHTSESVKYDSI